MSNANAPKPKSKWNVNNNNISLDTQQEATIALYKNQVSFFKLLLPELGNHEEELEGKVNAFNESISAFSNTIQGYTQNAPNNSLIEKVKSLISPSIANLEPIYAVWSFSKISLKKFCDAIISEFI